MARTRVGAPDPEPVGERVGRHHEAPALDGSARDGELHGLTLAVEQQRIANSAHADVRTAGGEGRDLVVRGEPHVVGDEDALGGELGELLLVDDDGTVEAALELLNLVQVGVVPEGARVRDDEVVGKRGSGLDGILDEGEPSIVSEIRSPCQWTVVASVSSFLK